MAARLEMSSATPALTSKSEHWRQWPGRTAVTRRYLDHETAALP